MLEAVLVLAAAVADAFRPRWALLTEIALLRHQLAVLQRSIATPRVARFDRIVLVALAAVTPTWRNVLRIVPTRDPASLAPRRLQGPLAVAESNAPGVAPCYGDGHADPIDGVCEQTLGRREDPRRTAQARRQSQQAHDPEVHAGGAARQTARAAVVHVSTKPRPARRRRPRSGRRRGATARPPKPKPQL